MRVSFSRLAVLFSFTLLTGCLAEKSTSPSSNRSMPTQQTSQTKLQEDGGTIGNGGSVVELPDGVAVADSFFKAPNYKLPDFYIARIESFDTFFPGVRKDIAEIIALLNRRYRGVEVVRFVPEEFEYYLTSQFSKEDKFPVASGLISKQVAYTFIFKSLDSNYQEELQHRVIEVSPQIQKLPVRIQSLILLHEALHHHPNLGFDDYYHHLIAGLVDGADIMMKVRDLQHAAFAKGELYKLNQDELQKITNLQRVLCYLPYGSLPKEDFIILRGGVDSPFDKNHSNSISDKWEAVIANFVYVNPSGGGVVEIPIQVDEQSYWNKTSVFFRQNIADAKSALDSNYIAVDGQVLINGFSISADQFRETPPLSLNFWKGLHNNTIINTEFHMLLDGSDCVSNSFQNILMRPNEAWYQPTVVCQNSSENKINALKWTLSMQTLRLKSAQKNKIENSIIGGGISLVGNNSQILNSILNFQDGTSRDFNVESNVKIVNSYLYSSPQIISWQEERVERNSTSTYTYTYRKGVVPTNLSLSNSITDGIKTNFNLNAYTNLSANQLRILFIRKEQSDFEVPWMILRAEEACDKGSSVFNSEFTDRNSRIHEQLDLNRRCGVAELTPYMQILKTMESQ